MDKWKLYSVNNLCLTRKSVEIVTIQNKALCRGYRACRLLYLSITFWTYFSQFLIDIFLFYDSFMTLRSSTEES
jgi:hypothetical protein